MIRKLKMSDRLNFLDFCSQREKYSDFYITKDNKRLFLSDLKTCNKVFNDCLKRNDKCLIKEKDGSIDGLLLINGYADKHYRKYMKLYSYDKQTIDDLIKTITWTFPTDLYVKVKNENPILEVLLGTRIYNLIFKKNSRDSFIGYGFRLIGRRGKEALLCRKYNFKYDYSKKRRYVKEGDE